MNPQPEKYTFYQDKVEVEKEHFEHLLDMAEILAMAVRGTLYSPEYLKDLSERVFAERQTYEEKLKKYQSELDTE